MPITALQRPPEFPEIGRLRKGAPKGDRMPGRDLNYFRFDTPDPELAALFESIYGKTPRAVKIIMPFQTVDQNFSAFREHRNGTKLFHTCDGDYEWSRIGGKLTKTDRPCPTAKLDDRVIIKGNSAKNPDKCQAVGRLSMIVGGLKRFGYVLLTTTSVIDISRIHAQLSAIELMAGGDLRNIPMVLRRVDQAITYKDKEGTDKKSTRAMLQIEIDPAWAALRLAAMDESALIEAMAPRGALPMPASDRPMLTAPPTIAHNGYAVNPASGEIIDTADDDDDDSADFWPDEEDRLPVGTEPPKPEPTTPAPAKMNAGQIKQAWRDLEKAGVTIPAKFWEVDFKTLDEAGFIRAAAWIAERRAELAAK